MTLTIELPDAVTQELDSRHISPDQVRTFVVQTIEAWLRLPSTEALNNATMEHPSRFSESAIPFIEKLVRENRELVERLVQL